MPKTNQEPLQEKILFGVGSEDPEYAFEVVEKDGRVTLKNCAVLQRESRNGRVYTEKAQRSAVPLYEGLSVYVNHGSFGDYTKRIGTLRESKYDPAGINRADFVLNMKHPTTPQLIDDARNNPSDCALSHEVPAEGYEAEMVEETHQITDLFEIDCVAVVDRGGVNKGLNEGIEMTKDQLQEAIAAALESKDSKVDLSKDSITEMSESIAKVLEGCGCSVGPMESELQTQLEALTTERDELAAKVEELTSKLGNLEAQESLRVRTEEILSEASEIGVEVDNDLMGTLVSMEEKESVTLILKNLKPKVAEEQEDDEEDGNPEPRSSSGTGVSEGMQRGPSNFETWRA